MIKQEDFFTKVSQFLLLVVLSLFAFTAAWSAPDHAEIAPVKTHIILPNPSLTLFPDTVQILAGTQIKLTAKPSGGEAILFSLDWSINEGESGGRIEAGARNSEGAFEATYFAPTSGLGPYHIQAKLHEYPSVTAGSIVYIVPAQ
jgi:hypothetical protein